MKNVSFSAKTKYYLMEEFIRYKIYTIITMKFPIKMLIGNFLQTKERRLP